MTPVAIPDPSDFLPSLPPIVTVILHWIAAIIALIWGIGVAFAFIWGFYKSAWVRNYGMEYPVTKWSKRFDLWITLATNFPQFLNKKAQERGVSLPFKFLPGMLTTPPLELTMAPKYTVRPKTGPYSLVVERDTGKIRMISDMMAVSVGLPSDHPWTDEQRALAYQNGEPYSEPARP